MKIIEKYLIFSNIKQQYYFSSRLNHTWNIILSENPPFLIKFSREMGFMKKIFHSWVYNKVYQSITHICNKYETWDNDQINSKNLYKIFSI